MNEKGKPYSPHRSIIFCALPLRCNKKNCESFLNIRFGGALINEKVPEKKKSCSSLVFEDRVLETGVQL